MKPSLNDLSLRDLVEVYDESLQRIQRLVRKPNDPYFFSLENYTRFHWMLAGGRLVWSTEPFTPRSIERGDDLYSEDGGSLTVLRAGGIALVCDREYLAYAVDESLECTDPDLVALYGELW